MSYEQRVLETGETIRFDPTKVLRPDEITIRLGRYSALLLELQNARRLSIGQSVPEAIRILDIGTGSGAFLVAFVGAARRIAELRNGIDVKNIELIAIDVDPVALEVAEKNLSQLDVVKTSYIQGDFTNPEAWDQIENESVDVAYFNPPFLPPGTPLRPEFIGTPDTAVYTDNAAGMYKLTIPHIVDSLNPMGVCVIREPSSGDLSPTSIDNDPVVDDRALSISRSDSASTKAISVNAACGMFAERHARYSWIECDSAYGEPGSLWFAVSLTCLHQRFGNLVTKIK